MTKSTIFFMMVSISWITLAVRGQYDVVDYLAPPVVLSLEDYHEDPEDQEDVSYQPNSRREFLSTVWKGIITTF